MTVYLNNNLTVCNSLTHVDGVETRLYIVNGDDASVAARIDICKNGYPEKHSNDWKLITEPCIPDYEGQPGNN